MQKIGIEDYIRRLNFSSNFYNNLVVIDLDSEDDTRNIISKLEEEGMNIKFLEREEGMEYFDKMIAPK